MRDAHSGSRPASPDAVTIRVPFVIRRRGGRRTMMISGGKVTAIAKPTGYSNTAFVRALAKAYRWRRLLETGVYSTVAEIAIAERVNDSYVSRVLRLTLLAPDILEALVDHRGMTRLGLERAMRPFPIEWGHQRAVVSGND